MTAIEPWHCLTCGRQVTTLHCSTCGERAVRKGDLTLASFALQVFHALTDLDSKLIRSLRFLLLRPGTLTLAYLEGPRKPYIAPFQLFLLANVVFFALQSLSPVKVFSTPLASHLHAQDWSPLAERLVHERLLAKDVTLEAYAPVFDRAVAVNAKSMVIVMAVPFALLLIAMFAGSGRPFVAHVIFSLHFYAFQLWVLSVLLLLLALNAWFGNAGLRWPGIDVCLFVIQLVSVALYLYVAIGKVYSSQGFVRIAKLAALVTAAGAVILGYRFFIFFVTLYGT